MDSLHLSHNPQPDPNTQKPEKPVPESQSSYLTDSSTSKTTPDPSKSIVEKRSRQYTQSRSDFANDNKPPLKKSQEPRELERSSVSKVPFLPFLPLQSIRTNAIEELYKELKDLKVQISEFEERSRVSSQCIETGKIKLKELKDRYLGLSKKSGLNSTPSERREELSQKLKRMQQKWVKNSLNLKSRILELEEQSKKLDSQVETLKSQVFQKAQQQKILKKNLNESGLGSEKGCHSCNVLNAGAQMKSFVYTPSYSSLCLA